MPGRGSETRKKEEQVLVRLHTNEFDQVRRLAGAHEVSVAELVRQLIHAKLGQAVPTRRKLRADPDLLSALARTSCEIGRQNGLLKQLCKGVRETDGRTDLHRRAERALANGEKTQTDVLAILRRLT